MRTKQNALLGRLTKVISPARLDKYHDPKSLDRWEALANYAWNIALCEAFYPLLNAVEIALRNTLDNAISNVWFPTACPHVRSWLDSNPSRLNPYGQADVQAAKAKLLGVDPQTGKLLPATQPIAHGDLVAAMDFGFWTGLLNNYYIFQRPTEKRLWPHLLSTAFPYSSLRHSSTASNRLNDIRHFRNRVFHHEPIWKRDLAADRDDILEVIGWISPESERIVSSLDRIPDVLHAEFRRELRARVFKEVRR